MHQFSILINNEVQGPLSESEIRDMIAENRVKPETLCAVAGSGEWEPLSLHFAFGSKLKISSQQFAVSAQEADAQANRLHPEVRRKLLMYTLADSVTVDQFTQVQAEIAIAAHEKRILSKIRRRQFLGWGAFLGCLGLALSLGLRSGMVADALSDMAANVVKDDDKAIDRYRRLTGEIRQFENVRKAAQSAVFAKPPGGANAMGTLLARTRVNENLAYRLRGTVEITPLADQVAKWNIQMNPDEIRVFVLNDPTPPEIARKLTAQSSVLDTMVSPLLDEAGFDLLRAKVVGGFPDATEQAESARLKADVEKMKSGDIPSVIERVEFRARLADRDPRGKLWGRNLHEFADRLRDLQGRARISMDPKARGELWSEFNLGDGAELSAWVLSAKSKEVRPDKQGNFILNETSRFDLPTANQRILVTARIAGDTVYLPWGSKHLLCRDLISEPMARDIFLQREQYKVTAKTVTGGRLHKARSRVEGRDLYIERTSPEWRFLSVARDKDPDSLIFLVDEKSFAQYDIGAVVPVSVLLKFDLYTRPAESVAPYPLSPAE